MPRNRLQEFVFTAMMVLCMVYGMTAYNLCIDGGFAAGKFADAALEMWPEVIAAFLAVWFAVNPLVRGQVSRRVSRTAAPAVFVLAMAGCTVLLMAPLMTLFVLLLHHCAGRELPALLARRLVCNYPCALLLQVCLAGPLVRLLFRRAAAPLLDRLVSAE